MVINFYKINSDKNQLNKVLENPTILECNVRTDIDFINPILLIKNYTIGQYNYLFVPEWNKYYFINSAEYTMNKIYKLNCEIDVLQTYKTELLANVLFDEQKIPFIDSFNSQGVNVLVGITNL